MATPAERPERPAGLSGGGAPTGRRWSTTIKSLIDGDPNTEGFQPYAFGEGEFDIVLEAYAGTTKIAENKIVVHVGGLGWDSIG